jgi:hypothetical protein
MCCISMLTTMQCAAIRADNHAILLHNMQCISILTTMQCAAYPCWKPCSLLHISADNHAICCIYVTTMQCCLAFPQSIVRFPHYTFCLPCCQLYCL